MRIDATRPVRFGAAVVFTFEAIGLVESLIAEKQQRRRKIYTISESTWASPNKWVRIAVILTALGLHLALEPEASKQRRMVDAAL